MAFSGVFFHHRQEVLTRMIAFRHAVPHTSSLWQMLDASGIILVPGSGFGQEEGTLHFRTTFLPSEDTMAETMARLSNSHKAFMDEYRD